MESLRFSLDGDSLNKSSSDSELERLRNDVKEMRATIKENLEIISSLRQQNSDLKEEIEELEGGKLAIESKVDKLKNELAEKVQELEAVSHATKELETAKDNLSRRLDHRTSQVESLAVDLIKAKKDLEKSNASNEHLRNKVENLTAKLELAESRRRRRFQDVDEEEVQIPRQKFSSLSLEAELQKHKSPVQLPPPLPPKNYNDPPIQYDNYKYHDENRPELTSAALHFPIADEVGEIMDSSSALGGGGKLSEDPTSLRYQYNSINRETRSLAVDAPMRAQNENIHHCINHQPKQRAPEPEIDPIAEQKMRIERANELARRNLRTKPLHQTSYPLELDTFDAPELTETDIKRGTIPRQALASLSSQKRQQQLRHQPLQHQQFNNQNNHYQHQPPQPVQPPVPRKTYKKAEAFIV